MEKLEISLEILPSNSRSRQKVDIHFATTGIVQISHLAAEKFSIKPSHHVAVAKDPNKKEDWYLLVAEKEVSGFIALRGKEGSNCLFFNSSSWCRSAVEQFSVEGKKSVKFLLGAEPFQYQGWKAIPIITKSAH